MIEVQDLTKNFGPVQALRGVSFEVERGQVVGLLGPNGAGKSTAMRILTGFIGPTSGTAKIDGIEVFDDPVACQRKIGYLPEGNPLYLDLRLIESLRFAAEMHGLRGAERDKAILESVQMAGLEGMERRTIGTFSKGFRQRVGLAQALLHKPQILILDEPTSGLDPNQQEDMRRLIRRLGEDRTIILSTHILPEVEASCSRAMIINAGELVAEGTVEEIRAHASGGAKVNAILRGTPDAVTSAFQPLPYVDHVDALPTRDDAERLQVVLTLSEEPAPALLEQIATTAFENGLPLSSLGAERASLEQIFAQLTLAGSSQASGDDAGVDFEPAPVETTEEGGTDA
ncbi:MAG: ATP-binding cassette domain-containing protein [Planctomycetota bacterium]|nr:ATP-binding cassette domain-containing protein [Planctomycetota bacterium]